MEVHEEGIEGVWAWGREHLRLTEGWIRENRGGEAACTCQVCWSLLGDTMHEMHEGARYRLSSLAGVLGAYAVQVVEPLLPWALSFAAGRPLAPCMCPLHKHPAMVPAPHASHLIHIFSHFHAVFMHFAHM